MCFVVSAQNNRPLLSGGGGRKVGSKKGARRALRSTNSFPTDCCLFVRFFTTWVDRDDVLVAFSSYRAETDRYSLQLVKTRIAHWRGTCDGVMKNGA